MTPKPMTRKRFREIQEHMRYVEDGSPLKDFEDTRHLIDELWDEVVLLRAENNQ